MILMRAAIFLPSEMAEKPTPAALEANCLQSRVSEIRMQSASVCDALHLLVNDEQELELARLHGLVEQRLPKTLNTYH